MKYTHIKEFFVSATTTIVRRSRITNCIKQRLGVIYNVLPGLVKAFSEPIQSSPLGPVNTLGALQMKTNTPSRKEQDSTFV